MERIRDIISLFLSFFLFSSSFLKCSKVLANPGLSVLGSPLVLKAFKPADSDGR